MKTVIYSANIGGYDYFKKLKVFDPNARYILFTDNKYYRSDIWEICHIDFIDQSLDNRRKARYVKINPHILLPSHDVSIWVDNCYVPKFDNVDGLLTSINFTDNDIMCYKHDIRDCIYDEANAVINNKLDYESLVYNQMMSYQNEEYPRNYGLFDSGFTIRKNNLSVSSFNDIWWEQVKNYSARDQLSQVYSSWKSGVNISPIEIGRSIYMNDFLNPKSRHPKRWTTN